MIFQLSDKLTQYTDGLSRIEIDAATVSEAYYKLQARYPRLHVELLRDDGALAKRCSSKLEHGPQSQYLWDTEHLDLKVAEGAVITLEADVPVAAKDTMQVVLGVVMIIVGAILVKIGGAKLAAMGWGMIMSGIGSVVSGIGMMLMDDPDMGGDSQTYSFSGIRNTTVEGTPLGLVYGKRRVGGHWLNVYTDVRVKPEEGRSRLQDTWLYGQLGLCEGEIADVSDVIINDRRLDMYTSVETDIRRGTTEQTAMPWFNIVENTENSGQLITPSGATHQLQAASDSATVLVMFPNGFYTPNDSEDGMERATVHVTAWYRERGTTQWFNHSVENPTRISKAVVADVHDYIDSTHSHYDSETGETIYTEWDVTDTAYAGEFKSGYLRRGYLGVENIFLGEIYDGIPLWYTASPGLFRERTRVVVEREIDLEFPHKGLWDVKLTRAEEQLTEGTDSCYFKSISAKYHEEFAYPRTAMLGVKIEASDEVSGGLPNITCEVKGRKVKVPNGYDGENRVWATAWDGTMAPEKQWTDNPAWCLYDLLTDHSSGLGDFVELDTEQRQILLAQLVLLSDYCDERVETLAQDGSTEPRWSINAWINNHKNARDILRDFMTAFTGTAFYQDGFLKVDADRPRPMSQIVAMSNIKEDSYQLTTSSWRHKINSIEVEYPDAEMDYAAQIFRVDTPELQEDPRLEVVQETLKLEHVTSRSQAVRLARWILLTSQRLNAVQFTLGADGLLALPGDVIGVQHDTPQWGWGGRVEAVEGRTITLSQPVEYRSGAWHIQTRRLLDTGVTSYPVTPQWGVDLDTGEYTEATQVSVDVSAEGYIAEGDVYALGLEGNGEVKPFKIMALERQPDDTVNVQALEYSSDLYDLVDDLDADLVLYMGDYSGLEDPTDATVTDVRVEDYSFTDAHGQITYGLEVFYAPPRSSWWAGCVVAYRKSMRPLEELEEGEDRVAGVWHEMPLDRDGYVLITPLQMGQSYDILVMNEYKDGTRQVAAQFSETPDGVSYIPDVPVTGEIAAPSAPFNLTATNNLIFSIGLDWALPDDPTTPVTEIWAAYMVNDREQATHLSQVQGTNFTHNGVHLGDNWFYWIRTRSKAGKYSDWHPLDQYSGVHGRAEDDPGVLLDILQEQISESQLNIDLRQQIDLGNSPYLSDMSNALIEQFLTQDEQFYQERVLITEEGRELSQIIEGVQAEVEGNKALSFELQSAYADLTSAVAEQVEAVQTELDGRVTTVEETMTSVDGVTGEYMVKIDNNGHVSGFGLLSELKDGTYTSAFIVRANVFGVVAPDGTGGENYPFTVGMVGGQAAVGIDGSMLIDGTVTADKVISEEIQVSQLSALSQNLGYITSGAMEFRDTQGVVKINSVDGYSPHIAMYNVGAETAGQETVAILSDYNGNGPLVRFGKAGDPDKFEWYDGSLTLPYASVGTLEIAGNAVTLTDFAQKPYDTSPPDLSMVIEGGVSGLTAVIHIGWMIGSGGGNPQDNDVHVTLDGVKIKGGWVWTGYMQTMALQEYIPANTSKTLRVWLSYHDDPTNLVPEGSIDISVFGGKR